jgi:hypothetical protein
VIVLKDPSRTEHALTAQTSYSQKLVTVLVTIGNHLMFVFAQFDMEVAAEKALDTVHKLKNPVVRMGQAISASFCQ